MEKRLVQALLLLITCQSLFAQTTDQPRNASDSIIIRQYNPFTSFQLLTRESKKVVLQWTLESGLSPDYFSIERNVDGKNYETIGVIKSANPSNKYEFTDEIPTRGTSFYRIKLTNKRGEIYHSDSAESNLPGSSIISFYPNPADNVLIIRSSYHADLLITDGMGKSRITRAIGVGPSIIDVSTLEKGVYLLRITDKQTSQQQIEKFLKN